MANLKVVTWNTNGLYKHKYDIQTLLTNENIDVLLVSEAHLTPNHKMAIRNYNIYSTYHPDGTAHAGTAVIIKKHIKHELLQEYKTESIQATTITVQDKLGSMTLSAVYCPPKHTLKEETFTTYFKTLGNRFLCGGDWNAKNTYWGSRLTLPRGREMKKSLDKNKLHILSTGEPSYWPTDPNKLPDLLDFFVYKGLSDHYLSVKTCLDSSSDHTPVIATISTTIIQRPVKERLYTKKTDWDAFRDYIDKNLNLTINLKTKEDIENYTISLTNLVQVASWTCTPDSTMTKGSKNVPNDINMKIREKRRLRRVWHCSRHPQDKKNFNKAATELKQYLKDIEEETRKHKLENLNSQAKNEYSLWNMVKTSRDAPQLAQHPIKSNNTWARTDIERAEIFREYLGETFTPNTVDIGTESEIQEYLKTDLQLCFPIKSCSPREVLKEIKGLELNKAPGFCLITAEILRQLPKKAVVAITQLFNSIIRVGHVPITWKVSEIIMVPKPGKPPHHVSSYRPISLLPTLSKLFEKIISRRLIQTLNANNIIPQHQFGFRTGHSTIEQVHRIVNKIRDAIENKQYCSAVFLDIQQAFDKVWHLGLLYKIKNKLPHNFFLLLKSYLENRIFRVKINDTYSAFQDIKAGVPQGSILGPTLYLIYTADIPTSHNILSATFADDTAVLSNHENPNTASMFLQSHLNKINQWMEKWGIKASSNKSVHVTFTLRKDNCPQLKLGNDVLPQQDTTKYLGIHLDRKQTWKTHITKKRDELNIRLRNLSWLIGRRSHVTLKNKILIYKAIIKPIWTYGIELWGTAKNSNVEILQRFQNKALRMISDTPLFITNSELHKYTEMKTVKEEVEHMIQSYRHRIKAHTNNLATALNGPLNKRRLKRHHIWDIVE